MQEYVIDTYKSIWVQDLVTGNYKRQQKSKYPLETLVNYLAPIIRHIPKVRAILPLLSKKSQGVDFYKYYTDIITSGSRGKWDNQTTEIIEKLSEAHLPIIENKNLLDISGEPGFFASDLKSLANHITVTGFAEEVAEAMQNHLGVEAVSYDFQNDQLQNKVKNSYFDYIFVRYAIGFCENLELFFHDCIKVLKQEGFLYISFSPASRAVCARWMFDDYTYLRQYTKEHLVQVAESKNFEYITEWDEGSYDWNYQLHPLQKFLSLPYTSTLFRGQPASERKQHNVAILFSKSV